MSLVHSEDGALTERRRFGDSALTENRRLGDSSLTEHRPHYGQAPSMKVAVE